MILTIILIFIAIGILGWIGEEITIGDFWNNETKDEDYEKTKFSIR